MTFSLSRLPWLMSLAALLALPASAVGCAADEAAPGDEIASSDSEEGATTDEVTEVSHSKVKRQSIGNCWLYATASWLEALHKGVDGEELNTSETYLTYWDWFEKIANNGGTTDHIETGGTYTTAAELINRYGIMLEGDFIPSEVNAEMSSRQSKAQAAINESLKNGALKTATARKTKKLVRAELDKAFGLSPEVITQLDATFGVSVTKTLDKSYATSTKKLPAGVKIIRPRDFTVRLRNPSSGEFETKSLQDAVGKKGSWWGSRTGTYAWNEVDYPTSASSRRTFWTRVQRALHDGQPVIVSWFVDFNALTSDAKFTVESLNQLGPGRQGGHMTVMHDYEIENVPGFGTLKAGVEVTDPEALDAALDPSAKITFIRIKNSWGAFRPDRWQDAVLPGYHDLMMTYLNGPVKRCSEKADGSTDTTSCSGGYTPLWDVVLPPSY